jgi:hypothetical protein
MRGERCRPSAPLLISIQSATRRLRLVREATEAGTGFLVDDGGDAAPLTIIHRRTTLRSQAQRMWSMTQSIENALKEGGPADNYEILHQRNVAAYSILFDLEVILRELIAVGLVQKYGSRWDKHGLPNDIRQKVREGVSSERATRWTQLTLHHPLYYLDFPDLKKLIINNANWPSSFELVFTKKGAVESSLSEIELIRNKIAHSRPLSEDELEILVAAKAKLFAGLSQRDLDAAKEAASHAISIRKILGTLESSILSSMAAIQAGDPLTLEHLESFMLTD